MLGLQIMDLLRDAVSYVIIVVCGEVAYKSILNLTLNCAFHSIQTWVEMILAKSRESYPKQ